MSATVPIDRTPNPATKEEKELSTGMRLSALRDRLYTRCAEHNSHNNQHPNVDTPRTHEH